ncbi:MAG TPA: hypothetical protein DCL42_06860, partial [Deltaproteobacteria bacterium]|nr:hypothetical protein [Deltaproteobacteria bacterium]
EFFNKLLTRYVLSSSLKNCLNVVSIITKQTISKKTYQIYVIPEGLIGNLVLIETISPIEAFGDDRWLPYL